MIRQHLLVISQRFFDGQNWSKPTAAEEWPALLHQHLGREAFLGRVGYKEHAIDCQCFGIIYNMYKQII